jgi:hypothetical protein
LIDGIEKSASCQHRSSCGEQLTSNGYRQRNPKTRRCEKILGLDALHASDKDKVAGSRAEAPGPLRFYGAGRIEGLGADINRTPMLNP